MARRPSCGAAIDRMRPAEKTITSPGRFLSPQASLPGNRILGGPCGIVWIGWRQLSTKRTKARQRGQGIVFRGKSRPARRLVTMTGRGESIPSAGDSGENRPKSVCGSVCTFGFRGQEVPQCLQAVGLEPDSIVGRMQSYAPYAVPLKGKRPKKVQLPKEVHKVHTASCMCSQPYSLLAFRFRQKSAYGLHTAAYEVHTDA